MQMEISETHFKEPKQKKSDIIKFDIDDWFLNIIDLYFFISVSDFIRIIDLKILIKNIVRVWRYLWI